MQHALVRMLEKWKASFDKEENIGAILMDLSKAFDCNASGFSREAMRLVNSFSENGHQRVKINGSFSTYCTNNCLMVFHKIGPWSPAP